MDIMTLLLVVILLVALAGSIGIWLRPSTPEESMRRLLEEQQAKARQDGQSSLAAQLQPVLSQIGQVQKDLASTKAEQEATLLKRFQEVQLQVGQGLQVGRKEQAEQLAEFRTTLDSALSQSRAELTQRLEAVQAEVQRRLQSLQEGNEQKLEQMRVTVDEKLHATLEKRLGESFTLVAQRLEEVQKGLGEMQNLAQDVGGLKRALTNVKTRGVLGEAQLGALLEQYLSPGQYEANVKPRPRSNEIVEYAVKLPGVEEGSTVWLPIDAKFPIEDYQRLMDAYEAADKDGVEVAGRALEARILSQARDIRDKYISVPNTTDFALLFLPFEGLYAEALRRPDLLARVQRECKVTFVGPTTLTAFLNSLQVGFKTLAITKQSADVWKTLGKVKTEFGRFGDALEAVQKKLDEAGGKLDEVAKRRTLMEKALARVEEIPEGAGDGGVPVLAGDSL